MKKIIKIIDIEFNESTIVDHLLVIDNELMWYFVKIENLGKLVVLEEGSLSLASFVSDKVGARDVDKKMEEVTVSVFICILDCKL